MVSVTDLIELVITYKHTLLFRKDIIVQMINPFVSGTRAVGMNSQPGKIEHGVI